MCQYQPSTIYEIDNIQTSDNKTQTWDEVDIQKHIVVGFEDFKEMITSIRVVVS